MKKATDIFSSIDVDTIKRAAERAFEGHTGETEVLRFLGDFDVKCNELYNMLIDGSYKSVLSYRKLQKTNSNGKERNIDSPTLVTRIYQHLFLELIEPIYYSKDNGIGLNCKKGCGPTSKNKRKSIIHRLKSLFYDQLDLEWALVIDQRKCYEHIKPKVFRRSMRRLVFDPVFIDFAVSVSFVKGKLPIGTPTSPMVHHIVMLGFDYFVGEMAPFAIRYADDVLVAFQTREEAQAAKWRIKNYWWYMLGIRSKRHTATVVHLDSPVDFCGYVFHRNNRGRSEHDKSYVRLRNATVARAKRCRTVESWASYYGLMKHIDAFNLMSKIENKMKLKDLTSKIRIDRSMDARNIEIRDLVGIQISIYDYEIRTNSQKQPNWIKCLVGFDEVVDGQRTGKIEAREFHGNYQGIIQFLLACELEFGKKELLPLEEVEIESQCGYIFKGSTNQLKYIA